MARGLVNPVKSKRLNRNGFLLLTILYFFFNYHWVNLLRVNFSFFFSWLSFSFNFESLYSVNNKHSNKHSKIYSFLNCLELLLQPYQSCDVTSFNRCQLAADVECHARTTRPRLNKDWYLKFNILQTWNAVVLYLAK